MCVSELDLPVWLEIRKKLGQDIKLLTAVVEPLLGGKEKL